MFHQMTRKCAALGIAALISAGCLGVLTGCDSIQLPFGQANSSVSSAQISVEEVSQEFIITAEGWDASTSSPVIVHFEGKTADDVDVDYYTAVVANKLCKVDMMEGYYTFQVLSPINADGSIYADNKGATVTHAKGFRPGIKSMELELTRVASDKVKQEQVDAILEALAIAVANGDATLTGEAGKAIINKASGNAVNAKNVDAKKIEEHAEHATENVATTATTATGVNNGGAATVQTSDDDYYYVPTGGGGYAGGDTGGGDTGGGATGGGGDTGGGGGGDAGGGGTVEPTPVEPEPTPVEPEPTPVEPEPTPVEPEPTPEPAPEA